LEENKEKILKTINIYHQVLEYENEIKKHVPQNPIFENYDFDFTKQYQEQQLSL
jgi:hypothetical protein